MRQTEQIEWVPVGEGLPPEPNWYLCTRGPADFLVVIIYHFDANGKWLAADFSPQKPIAWAHMPKGYVKEAIWA